MDYCPLGMFASCAGGCCGGTEPVPGVLVGSRNTPHPLTASVSTDQAAG